MQELEADDRGGGGDSQQVMLWKLENLGSINRKGKAKE